LSKFIATVTIKEPFMGITFTLEVFELIPDQETSTVHSHPFFSLSEKWTGMSRQLKKLRGEAPRGRIRPEQLASLDYEGCTGGLVDILKTISKWSGEQYALSVGFDDEHD
jgi:hypothetical protein